MNMYEYPIKIKDTLNSIISHPRLLLVPGGYTSSVAKWSVHTCNLYLKNTSSEIGRRNMIRESGFVFGYL